MMISPTVPVPGTKRCLPCASWGTWGPLTGSYGVSADSLRLPDAEYVIGWDLALPPLHQIPKGVGHVHLGAIYGVTWGISRFIGTARYRIT